MSPWWLTFCLFLVAFSASSCNGQFLLNLKSEKHPEYKVDKSNLSAVDLKTLEDSKLILTPLIQSGKIAEARRLARVDEKEFNGFPSFSGFLTVNETFNSNLFFWFFPAETQKEFYSNKSEEKEDFGTQKDVPLILWLQGGPGASSLFGLFNENGPFFINDDLSIRKNPISWNKNYSMLYIDNPVGAGFSFTNPGGYVNSVKTSSDQLYIGLVQFFKLFPEYQESPFFVAGESFAGKYIPGIAHKIHKMNRNFDLFGEGELKINLEGIALGNAVTDPINMMDYSEFAYQTGLVDIHVKRQMKAIELLIQETIDINTTKTYEYWNELLLLIRNNSLFVDLYNILEPLPMKDSSSKFVNQTQIRKAIHVGTQEYFFLNKQVYDTLIPDICTSATDWLTTILDESDIRVLYYNGNLDIIVAYPLSVNFYQNLKWKGAKDYRMAKRQYMGHDNKLTGYYKKANRHFTEAVILNAGHMAAMDQPKATLELMTAFINEEF